MAVKILDIGAGKEGTAQIVFNFLGDLEITRLDADPANEPDILFDIASGDLPEEHLGKADIVYASHVLEHIDRERVFQAVKNCALAVRPGGELWVSVPSLEWACKMILYGHDDAGVQLTLFGGQRDQWDYHRSAFTLAALRQLIDMMGLTVRRAYQAPLQLSWYGKDFTALQNVVIGYRPE